MDRWSRVRLPPKVTPDRGSAWSGPVNPRDEAAGLGIPQVTESDFGSSHHFIDHLLDDSVAHPVLDDQAPFPAESFNHHRHRPKPLR
jgi:hypothetical protein